MKKVFEGILNNENFDYEDQGKAIVSEAIIDPTDTDIENGMYVRVQSWDENKIHSDFKQFIGKKIRITVETI